MVYLTPVRPLLEYVSCVWDPHQLYLINALEKVQRHATRWVASNYNPMSGVTYLLDQLHWKSLQSRRCVNCKVCMSICEPRVANPFAEISRGLSYSTKLLHVPLAWNYRLINSLNISRQ